MFDDETLARSREAAARWRAAYQKTLDRFGGDRAPERARAPETESGLPINNVYFPHDIAHLHFDTIGTPGAYPFTRGNLAAQYQFMPWANQPVIGYGLPEHTRERMDFLTSQGMMGYFGSPFFNLVQSIVRAITRSRCGSADRAHGHGRTSAPRGSAARPRRPMTCPPEHERRRTLSATLRLCS